MAREQGWIERQNCFSSVEDGSVWAPTKHELTASKPLRSRLRIQGAIRTRWEPEKVSLRPRPLPAALPTARCARPRRALPRRSAAGEGEGEARGGGGWDWQVPRAARLRTRSLAAQCGLPSYMTAKSPRDPLREPHGPSHFANRTTSAWQPCSWRPWWAAEEEAAEEEAAAAARQQQLVRAPELELAPVPGWVLVLAPRPALVRG